MTRAGSVFGILPDGAPVARLSIARGNLSAAILSYGAIVQDLRLGGHEAPLILGFEAMEPYLAESIYFGAIVGRVANRIGHGRFEVEGKAFDTERNDRGHTLHGGDAGLHTRLWEIAEVLPDSVTLSTIDPAGLHGFPGNLQISCRYAIREPATLSVELTATTDEVTPCSLAHHSWFNLEDGGASSALDHRLRIAAEHYLPTDSDGLPTAEIKPVASSAFDFRRSRAIRREPATRYDHNFCLAKGARSLSFAARLDAPRSGVSLEVWTTEPGLQFFDGAMSRRRARGLDGIAYGPHAGLCLEPQGWPDAVNRADFPPVMLRPGETYTQHSEFRFTSKSTN